MGGQCNKCGKSRMIPERDSFRCPICGMRQWREFQVREPSAAERKADHTAYKNKGCSAHNGKEPSIVAARGW